MVVLKPKNEDSMTLYTRNIAADVLDGVYGYFII